MFKTPVTRSVIWIAHRGRQEGRARVLIDGHPRGTFDLYAPVASDRSFTFKGLSRRRHFVTIEVLGTKDAASRGRWVTVDGFNVGGNIREESALNVHYGTWKGVAKRAASGGSYRESGSAHAWLRLQFTGSRIDWLTATGPAYGRARVVIDGVAHTVDLYRARRHWRVRISFTRARAGNASHHGQAPRNQGRLLQLDERRVRRVHRPLARARLRRIHVPGTVIHEPPTISAMRPARFERAASASAGGRPP